MQRSIRMTMAFAMGALVTTAPAAAKSIVTRGNSQEAPPQQQGQWPSQQPQQPQGQQNNQQGDPTRGMTPEQRARWCREHPGWC